MEREQFDDLLRVKILEHDEGATPFLNKKKIWKKSTAVSRRKDRRMILSVAASVILVSGTWVSLWMGSMTDLATPKKVLQTTTSKVPAAQHFADSLDTSLPKSFTMEEAKPRLRPFQVEVVTNPVQSVDTFSTNIQEPPVQLPKADIDQGKESTMVVTPSVIQGDEFKITFKRGEKKVRKTAGNAIITSFKRGGKIEFGPKSSNLSDTDNYYVNSGKQFKIRFKH